MLCPFCNTARLDNDAPCPYCGASSPLRGNTGGPAGTGMVSRGMWQSPFPQMPFPQGQPQAAMQNSAQFPPAQTTDEQRRQAMLPALYQPPMGLIPRTEENALMPAQDQNLGELLAEMPGAEHVTYIPPMYTKPRAIIPRYRAVSGLLSMLIVTLLLCGGLSYYAKTSGKLNAFAQMAGIIPPPNLKATSVPTLPTPATLQVTGPAYNIINSATTTANINAQHVAVEQDFIFRPGQTIYLTYSVQHPKTPGTVTINWYTNNHFFQSAPPTQLINQAINGYTSEQYPLPSEGKVELYWNNVLAITLYFVVK